MIAAASALEQSLRLWVLWDAAQDAMQDPRHASDSPAPRLTRRESETLTLYAQGVSFGDIARLQGVRISTVREQTQSARAKLEVATTAQAAAKARRLGLIP